MESSRILLNTLRYTLGLTNLRDVSQLTQVSQSRLEQKFDAISERFSTRRMSSIYMRWLIHQDFTVGERLQSQVVEQWVSFVDSWGLEVEEAIALWAKTMDEDTESDEETKQLRVKRNSLRHEIESQFFKLKNPEPIPPSGLVEAVPPRRNHNIKTRGQIRESDEYANDIKTKSALENWPTKDIPFPSIETAVDTDTESEESSETASLDIKREHGEETAKKKARLDTGGSIPSLVLNGSGTISSPIDLTM
ncbi:hypothetical protein FOXG_08591 [Fusarium oxysporum f. sp. lycopersici 4287]|uniref:Uncharacterized protein n=2 Tax=Fusarium oxysporum TaxID=5507 RepID=A0A0J9V8D5_FUSO4|nr:hypothetical protein FOXG_08591 [Fusarium oxysporum f. sp. lycopersici 4287]EXK32335.1 hypothetical protein FOMG_12545 [Fusarium oxysporum f. sp. melonis 26406]KAJ9424072.1 hypothetical protein QL093DRAFT_2635029 [Fusarium oxysporum]KNB07423.1 hypothetical protein FOXG_08591 [Fusarium oxysporum f. sp. lycopersici 4287]